MRFLFLLLVALAACFQPLLAKKFTVNTSNKLPDTSPGDGQCRTSVNRCSLRAALDEANARPQRDQVVLPAGTFGTDDAAGNLGLAVRESVTIKGVDSASTILTGNGKERHFEILNEKLLLGLRNGEIGAVRPSSGKKLRSVAGTGDVSAPAGSFLFSGDFMYTSYFIAGVARYRLRRREAVAASSNKFTFEFDKVVINNGNGAGLTTPTTLALASNGDLLVNSFQPTNFGIRRYDPNTFAFKGIFINPPGIVNSMLRFGSLLYVTLVGSGQVRAYSASTGALMKSSSTALNTPRDIVSCGSGRLFVADEKNDRVVEFNADLGFVRVIVSDPGRLEDPQGLACLPGGDLFVKSKGSKLRQYKFGATSSTFVRDLTMPGEFIGGITTIVNRDHFDGPNVRIIKATLRDGKVSTGVRGPSLSIGRGCFVKVDKCVIRDNRGSVFGGAVSNSGTTKIIRSRLIDNSMPSSTLSGGGVTNSGGAIGNFGSITIKTSELSGNQAARGGAIWNSGSEGSVSVIQSTISNNFAGNAGGGIYNTRFTEIKYSTITENECGQFSGDPASRRAGCGFYSFRNPSTPNSVFTISSSIIANNKQLGNQGTFAPDCLAETGFSVRSFGGNIVGAIDSDKCKRFGSTNRDSTGSKNSPRDPGLGPLQFLSIKRSAGRPSVTSFTRGHDPKLASLAVTFNPFGSGGNPTDACPKKDQIGRRRPQGSVCDVGAIEMETQSLTSGRR